MGALSTIIDGAVGTVIAEHPKLFNPESKERTQKLLVREIMKSLVKEPRVDGDETPQPPIQEPTGGARELTPATDERAIAYCHMRAIAGAVAPSRYGGDRIYIPPEGDTAAVRAFANLPERKNWSFITNRAQLTAWLEFFDAALPDVPRRKIFENREGLSGVDLPWPWPPSKTGKIYDHPPVAEDDTL